MYFPSQAAVRSDLDLGRRQGLFDFEYWAGEGLKERMWAWARTGCKSATVAPYDHREMPGVWRARYSLDWLGCRWLLSVSRFDKSGRASRRDR